MSFDFPNNRNIPANGLLQFIEGTEFFLRSEVAEAFDTEFFTGDAANSYKRNFFDKNVHLPRNVSFSID